MQNAKNGAKVALEIALKTSGHAVERSRIRLAEAGPRAAHRGSAKHLRVRSAGAGSADVRVAATRLGGLQLVDEAGGDRSCGGGSGVVPIGFVCSVGTERAWDVG